MLIAINFRRLPSLRASMDAGANASVLPVLSVASLVGFGSVVAALPAFAMVRDWVLGIEGGPLVSLAVATNVLAVADRLGLGRPDDRARCAWRRLYEDRRRAGHRPRSDAPCRRDRRGHARHACRTMAPSSPLLAVCGATHRESYFDIVMVGIVSSLVALAVVIGLGSAFGSF